MVGDSSWIFPAFCGWVLLAALSFCSLFFVRAPYGRHQAKGWGPTLPSRAGWVLMEVPSLIVILCLYMLGENTGWIPTIALFLWAFHYTYRSFLYPALARLDGKTMPVAIAFFALVFNLGNAGFNGLTLFSWLPDSTVGFDEIEGVRLFGLVLFLTGFLVHAHSDHVLRGLRKEGEQGYKIPGKGLHRWVASPNYFGEIVEWLGFALFVQNLAGWSFLVWTVANLLPRALSNYQWYKEKFADYPEERKALIPFLL